MAYFLQTEISEKAHLDKSLQSIYGIGKFRGKLACKTHGFLQDARGKDLRRDHKVKFKTTFEEYKWALGSELKQIYINNCKTLIDIQSYKGRRHKFGYPVRGQRTHTNAKTQKRLHRRWDIQSIDHGKTIVFKKGKNQKKIYMPLKQKSKKINKK